MWGNVGVWVSGTVGVGMVGKWGVCGVGGRVPVG